jgi:hypothetical protein
MSDIVSEITKPKPADGKSCGSCNMCCKVLLIPWLDNKPKGVWCKDCKPGKGCGIWDTRPQGCADYFCYWLINKTMGSEWKPDVAKFIVHWEENHVLASIIMDPGSPHAWKREPYHSVIIKWADQRMSEGKGLVLIIGDTKFIITPDSVVPITHHAKETSYSFSRKNVNGKIEYNIGAKVPQDSQN